MLQIYIPHITITFFHPSHTYIIPPIIPPRNAIITLPRLQNYIGQLNKETDSLARSTTYLTKRSESAKDTRVLSSFPSSKKKKRSDPSPRHVKVRDSVGASFFYLSLSLLPTYTHVVYIHISVMCAYSHRWSIRRAVISHLISGGAPLS